MIRYDLATLKMSSEIASLQQSNHLRTQIKARERLLRASALCLQDTVKQCARFSQNMPYKQKHNKNSEQLLYTKLKAMINICL